MPGRHRRRPVPATDEKLSGCHSAADNNASLRKSPAVVTREVLPAYSISHRFITNEYAPQGRTTLAVSSLPGGEERYLNDIRSRRTVSTHDSGRRYTRSVCTRSSAFKREMLAIARTKGFSDLAAFRESLQTNPQATDQIRGTDSRRFPPLHRTDGAENSGTVRRCSRNPQSRSRRFPTFQAAAATHYITGTPDGTRPGRVVVATSNFAQRSLIAGRGDRLPRRHPRASHAALGAAATHRITQVPPPWAGNSRVYRGLGAVRRTTRQGSRLLPGSGCDFGRLSRELFRAVRLVVDTGIHSKGWTRDQVVDFFRKSGADRRAHDPVRRPTATSPGPRQALPTSSAS